jgi:hypothetical protein
MEHAVKSVDRILSELDNLVKDDYRVEIIREQFEREHAPSTSSGNLKLVAILALFLALTAIGFGYVKFLS